MADAEVASTSESGSLPGRQKQTRLSRLLSSPSFYLLLIVLVGGTVCGAWLVTNYKPEALLVSLGSSAPFITIFIHVVVALSPIPSDVISIANGAVYGFPLGAGLSWFGWWIAAILEFGIGYRVRGDFEFESHTQRMPAWLRRVPVDHPLYLICVRQIPWIGGHLTSFIPGASGVSLRRFIWCSAIAVIPGAVVMAAVGAGLPLFGTRQ